jgi:hypothetical protein
VARSICDISRTVLVWAVGMGITVTLGRTRPNYKW